LYFANVLPDDASGNGSLYICASFNRVVRGNVQGDDQLVKPIHYSGIVTTDHRVITYSRRYGLPNYTNYRSLCRLSSSHCCFCFIIVDCDRLRNERQETARRAIEELLERNNGREGGKCADVWVGKCTVFLVWMDADGRYETIRFNRRCVVMRIRKRSVS